jgi:DNA-3-methyladenine glycosylase
VSSATARDLAPGSRWGREQFLRGAVEVARALLGCTLVALDEQGPRAGVVVEVEAYLQDDPASHSFRGPTPRNSSMWAQGGVLYVYRSHGLHSCANFATGPAGRGEAVLVRALRPVEGLDRMRGTRLAARPGATPADEELCRGPGNLARALWISSSDDGLDACAPDARVFVLQRAAPPPSLRGARIGIARAADLPLRWFVAGERCVSAHKRGAPDQGAD